MLVIIALWLIKERAKRGSIYRPIREVTYLCRLGKSLEVT